MKKLVFFLLSSGTAFDTYDGDNDMLDSPPMYFMKTERPSRSHQYPMTISYDIAIKEDCSFWYDEYHQDTIIEDYVFALKDIYDYKSLLVDLAKKYRA